MSALHPCPPPPSTSRPRVPEQPRGALIRSWRGRRAARRHGARAAWLLQARRAGASLAPLVRRRPGGLGRLAQPGKGRGRAPALRASCGCRVAGGGERGEDGRPHPETVLPHPGQAAHQLHPAGPGEVMRLLARPAIPASGSPASGSPPSAWGGPRHLPRLLLSRGRLLSADSGPTSPALSLELGLHSRQYFRDGQLWPFNRWAGGRAVPRSPFRAQAVDVVGKRPAHGEAGQRSARAGTKGR